MIFVKQQQVWPLLLPIQHRILATHDFPAPLVTNMEAITFAIPVHFTMRADTGLGPTPIPHDAKSIVPDVDEVVSVDIALDIIVAQGRASGDRTIDQH